MDNILQELNSIVVRIALREGEQEVGHAYLYIIKNDLHQSPYGLLEDVLVHEDFRGRGLGTELVQMIISEARKRGCYKLVANSRVEREKVHQLYEKLGFVEYGKEFRMELKNPD